MKRSWSMIIIAALTLPCTAAAAPSPAASSVDVAGVRATCERQAATDDRNPSSRVLIDFTVVPTGEAAELEVLQSQGSDGITVNTSYRVHGALLFSAMQPPSSPEPQVTLFTSDQPDNHTAALLAIPAAFETAAVLDALNDCLLPPSYPHPLHRQTWKPFNPMFRSSRFPRRLSRPLSRPGAMSGKVVRIEAA